MSEICPNHIADVEFPVIMQKKFGSQCMPNICLVVSFKGNAPMHSQVKTSQTIFREQGSFTSAKQGFFEALYVS